MNTHKILYDENTLKFLKAMTILSFITVLIGVVGCFLEIPNTEMIVVTLLYVGLGIFLYCGCNLAAGILYIKRMKRYGYIIPKRKTDYGNDIRNVPRDTDLVVPMPYSKESRILCILTGIIFLGSIGWSIWFLCYWYVMKESAAFLFGVSFVIDIAWMVAAFMLYRQQDTTKYRDDVTPDSTLKVRTSLEKGLMTILVIMVITIFAKDTMCQMTKYVYKAHVSADLDYIHQIQREITTLLLEDWSTYGETASCEALLEGCYITDWDMPRDEFSRVLAERLEISHFYELRHAFGTVEGNAELYVKIEEDVVYVRLDNPFCRDGMEYYEAK